MLSDSYPVIRDRSIIETAQEIRVRGIVQGVGFRPMVYRLARSLDLRGWVLNDAEGVLIRVAGSAEQMQRFGQLLYHQAPLLSRIDSVERLAIAPDDIDNESFAIAPSRQGIAHTKVAPDAAICPNCIADITNPSSRFFNYPFTNCTHCGPRLTIIRMIPYDRPHTSMSAFPMCDQCKQDYHDVEDRRFHAQPVACPICGPALWLERSPVFFPDYSEHFSPPYAQSSETHAKTIQETAEVLKRGEIVAIKGLGGIHLACDATNEQAVSQLRTRKHRYDKPLAVMVKDISMAQRYCYLSDVERSLLESSVAPIVLLCRRDCCGEESWDGKSFEKDMKQRAIAPSVFSSHPTLGVMLPYTPLHWLLMQQLDRPIVLTSGNRSDEPQCITNSDARDKLGAIASYFLLHNRDIVNRLDDSVVRVVNGEPQILRRARGYAPAPLPLPEGFKAAPSILAMGSELKNTFCLIHRGEAILSQHLGDLENATAYQAYQETLDRYQKLFDFQPEAIAIDHHPDYLSSKLGYQLVQNQLAQNQLAPDQLTQERLAQDKPAQECPLYPIQHHHAHIAACMVEHGLPLDHPPVLGVALDGLGYGEDGTLWGGEWLLVTYPRSQRLAHLPAVAMLGGSQAIRQPWRNTYAHLMAVLDWDTLSDRYGQVEIVQFLAQKPRKTLDQLLRTGLQSPLASSAGRLFDAVAAAVGCHREQTTYEGQGAIALEHLMTPAALSMAETSYYPIALDLDRPLPQIDLKPLWLSLLDDLHQGVGPALISARFHVGLAEAIAQLTRHLAQRHGVEVAVLSGGVFQNQGLQVAVQQRLSSHLQVLTHHRVPANDGGLSLGQGAIAAARHLLKTSC